MVSVGTGSIALGAAEKHNGNDMEKAVDGGKARDGIVVQGARVHNLQSVSCRISRNSLTVITGVSGSGKSSLAFDTLFAEGQRRYLESLPPYARSFLEKMDRPAVDFVEGLSPAISIGQFTSPAGPRSTLATVAELHDYLRLLFAHLGVPHCPHCGRIVRAVSPGVLAERLLAEPEGTRVTLLSPMFWMKEDGTPAMGTSGTAAVADAARSGFVRVCLDGEICAIDTLRAERTAVAKSVDAVVDRLVIREGVRTRLVDSVELAMRRSGGEIRLMIRRPGEQTDRLVNESERMACPDCRISFPVLVPSSFSFNSPAGACPACGGLGIHLHTESDTAEDWDGEEGAAEDVCEVCHGARLRPEALACRLEVPGLQPENIAGILSKTVSEIRLWFDAFAQRLTDAQKRLSAHLLAGFRERLLFLEEAGVGYLRADRPSASLSGGEMRRVRLASALGQRLSGVLYVLDEPTAGLHPHDVDSLVRLLLRLRDAGNTLVVVEHQEAVIRAADEVIELGPGAGVEGGRIVFQGSVSEMLGSGQSLSGAYFSGREAVVSEPSLPPGKSTRFLWIREATKHNLKGISPRFPLGRISVVTGVSGAGKSTLTEEVLGANLERLLSGGRGSACDDFVWRGCAGIAGTEPIDKIVRVGKAIRTCNPRSNLLTFTGVYGLIRSLYAATPLARARGYTASRFSFNTKGGRCEACKGEGRIRFEMSFLPDVTIPCEVCGGKRFNPETLDIHWAGRSIAELLLLTVHEAADVFRDIPQLERQFRTLDELGLGYLALGQPVSTLSGGEVQRLLLAAELSRPARHHTLYVLDEPSSGQHPADIRLLLKVLRRLRDAGHTIIAVDHNPYVIRSADWIVDLGPGGGDAGGCLLTEGTPATISACEHSYTAELFRTKSP